MAIKRILVPVDLSDASLQALDYAAKFAQPLGAALVVLFVVEPLYYTGGFGLILEEQQRAGREALSRLERLLEKRRVQSRAMVRTGAPYQVIGQEARKQKADLIIMATHGRTGVSHLMLGSVADKVVRTAPCPVLTVRSKLRNRRGPKFAAY